MSHPARCQGAERAGREFSGVSQPAPRNRWLMSQAAAASLPSWTPAISPGAAISMRRRVVRRWQHRGRPRGGRHHRDLAPGQRYGCPPRRRQDASGRAFPGRGGVRRRPGDSWRARHQARPDPARGPPPGAGRLRGRPLTGARGISDQPATSRPRPRRTAPDDAQPAAAGSLIRHRAVAAPGCRGGHPLGDQ